MLKAPGSDPSIVIIGGDGRCRDLRVAASIRSFPSSRYGGDGSVRQAIAAINGGSVHLVVLLVRWLGHTEFWSIKTACAAAMVPFVIVAGGLSSARRQVREFLERRHALVCDRTVTAAVRTTSRRGARPRRGAPCRTVRLRRYR